VFLLQTRQTAKSRYETVRTAKDSFDLAWAFNQFRHPSGPHAIRIIDTKRNNKVIVRSVRKDEV
jgi:hypothetical protein